MTSNFDKQFGKDIAKAIILFAITTSIGHLIAWGFEKLKGKKVNDDKDETQQ